jgi:hypothetical protein
MTLKSCCFVFAAAGLAIALSASASDAKPTTVTAIITDEADSPIQDAVVGLTCTGKRKTSASVTAKSAANGRLEFAAALSGVCNLNVAAPGFTPTLVGFDTSHHGPVMDLGKVRLKISCSGPGVICDQVTPKTRTSETKR